MSYGLGVTHVWTITPAQKLVLLGEELFGVITENKPFQNSKCTAYAYFVCMVKW